LYECKTLFIALTQGVRNLSVDADSEIGDLDLSRHVAGDSWSAADAPDVVPIRFTASACQNLDRLAHHRIHTRPRKVVDRPFGVLEEVMEDGCVHRGWCRSGTECQRDVDAVSEERASRRI